MLLLVLLVLSVRNRKMAARPSSLDFYAPAPRAIRRSAPKNKSAHGMRRATTPDQHSGLLLSNGLDYAIREQAKPEVPESSPSLLAAPPESPAVQISDEVQMNSPSFPFEKLDPGAFAGISGFGEPVAASTIEAYIPPFCHHIAGLPRWMSEAGMKLRPRRIFTSRLKTLQRHPSIWRGAQQKKF